MKTIFTLRGLEEHSHHSLLLKKADKAVVEVLSYKVQKEQDLDEIEKLFISKGLKIKWLPKGRTACRWKNPSCS